MRFDIACISRAPATIYGISRTSGKAAFITQQESDQFGHFFWSPWSSLQVHPLYCFRRLKVQDRGHWRVDWATVQLNLAQIMPYQDRAAFRYMPDTGRSGGTYGAMQLTLTPLWPTSLAAVFVKPITPCYTCLRISIDFQGTGHSLGHVLTLVVL